MAPISGTIKPDRRRPSRLRRSIPAVILRSALVLALGLGVFGSAKAQRPPGATGAAAGPAAAPPPATNDNAQPPAPGDAPATPGNTATPSAPRAPAPNSGLGGSLREQTLSLKDLGAASPIRLLGTVGEGSLPFTVRRDERVTGGRLDLSLVYSPALVPDLSHLSVVLNGSVIESIPLPKDKNQGQTASLALDPSLF